jgi:hypothetical protein
MRDMQSSNYTLRGQYRYEYKIGIIIEAFKDSTILLEDFLKDKRRIAKIFKGYNKGINNAEVSLIAIANIFGIEITKEETK